MSDILNLISRWLDVLPEGHFDKLPGAISPDLVLRLPFVPPDIPNEIRGRDAVQETLARTATGRSPLILENVVSLRTDDPELVMTTANGSATMANGNLYTNSYVMLTRVRDGMVIEHTEYLNPLQIMKAMGA